MAGYMTTPTKAHQWRLDNAPATPGPQFRSKFTVSYEALLAGEHPWLSSPGPTPTSPLSPKSSSHQSSHYFSSTGKKPSAPRTRFFADLLCLKVDTETLKQLLLAIPQGTLVEDDVTSKGARIRDNVGSLWRECLKVWTDIRRLDKGSLPSSPTPVRDSFSPSGRIGSDDIRRANAIKTLIILSRTILGKHMLTSSSSLDLIWIFAGGIDEADEIFEALVAAIDEGMKGDLDNVEFAKLLRGQHGTQIQPEILLQDHTSSPHTDLPTLSELLFHRVHAVHLAIVWISYVSATNLSAYFIRRDLFVSACSLLQFVRKIIITAKKKSQGEGLAEEDVQTLRSVVRDTTLLLGLLAGLGQGGMASGAGIGLSYRGLETTVSPYFRRMCDWVDDTSMLLIQDALTQDFESSWRAFESKDGGDIPSSARMTASLGLISESFRKISLSESQQQLDTNLPPALVVSILPLFLLVRSNQAFLTIIFRPPAGSSDESVKQEDYESQLPSFASAFLSLSSYLATHGSLSDRAKSYSRLSLLIFLSLLSSRAGVSSLIFTERSRELHYIHLCQQRSGPLPVRAPPQEGQKSGIFSSFSFNYPTKVYSERKRLLPYVLDSCVQYMRHNLRKRLDTSGFLICLQVVTLSIQNCAQNRLLLEYDDWSEVWRTLNSTAAFLVARHTELRGVEIGKLGRGVLATLSFALVESDHFLQTKQDVNVLVYELVRSSESLRRLATIMTAGNDASEVKASPSNLPNNPKMNHLPGWRVLDLLFSAFDSSLKEWTEKRSAKGILGFPLSIASLSGNYFGVGSSSAETEGSSNSSDQGSRPSSSGQGASRPQSSSSKGLPGVQAVMDIVATLDLEQLIQIGVAERSRSRNQDPVDQEWIERAEAQCLAEAFRFAAEDMRCLLSTC